MRSVREQAADHDASAEQLAAIDAAGEAGKVDFDVLEAAVTRGLTCMTSAGIDVIGPSVNNDRGYPDIFYSYATSSTGRSEAETDAVAQECLNTHVLWLQFLYADSPQVVGAQQVRFDEFREAIVSCLRADGVRVAADANKGEIEEAALDHMEAGGRDCLGETGYYT